MKVLSKIVVPKLFPLALIIGICFAGCASPSQDGKPESNFADYYRLIERKSELAGLGNQVELKRVTELVDKTTPAQIDNIFKQLENEGLPAPKRRYILNQLYKIPSERAVRLFMNHLETGNAALQLESARGLGMMAQDMKAAFTPEDIVKLENVTKSGEILKAIATGRALVSVGTESSVSALKELEVRVKANDELAKPGSGVTLKLIEDMTSRLERNIARAKRAAEQNQ